MPLVALLALFVLFVFFFTDKNEKFDSVGNTSDITSIKQTFNKNKCKIAGCSRQLCIDQDEDLFTTCEYKEEYACYSKVNAVCEVQEDGKCGWTQSPELISCLSESRKNF